MAHLWYSQCPSPQCNCRVPRSTRFCPFCGSRVDTAGAMAAVLRKLGAFSYGLGGRIRTSRGLRFRTPSLAGPWRSAAVALARLPSWRTIGGVALAISVLALATGSVYLYLNRRPPQPFEAQRVLATVDSLLADKGQVDQAAELLRSSIVRNPGDPALNDRLAAVRNGIVIEMQFLYAPKGGGRTLSGRDGESALSSDDSYYLRIKTAEKCYAYVFQRDSRDAVQQLFPNPAWVGTSNPLLPGETRIPAADQQNSWFYLDDTVGEESIYLLASRWPQRDLEKLDGQGLLDALRGRADVKSPGAVYREFRFAHRAKTNKKSEGVNVP